MWHSVSASPLMTAEEVAPISIPGKVTELVRGRLVVREPPGTWHGAISAKLTYLLWGFVHHQRLGLVFGQNTGFKIGSHPDTVRAPDVAFVARERVGVIRERGCAELAPDLLAEILSPDDRPAEVLAKVADWLAAGTRIVWSSIPSDATRASKARTGASRFWGATTRWKVRMPPGIRVFLEGHPRLTYGPMPA